VCVTDARFDAHYLCNDGAFDASDATPEGGEGRVSRQTNFGFTNTQLAAWMLSNSSMHTHSQH
jgi:hypothetical protein